ncbi:MAG: exodeoxyribonuclease small subunit [Gammaproteobacteria bacterium]|nr:exodeoxyribonuclease small subunit [Gammaproteobacteria bacterium]
MTKITKEKLNLEQALDELNALVEKMEQGELNLEEALKDFERGVLLTRHCQKLLTDAEQKVQILMQQEGQVVLTNYQTDSQAND